ncbi:MAG: hypothetical protein OET79_00295, partial [Nitrospirota bacterium]|nr:hypothetical protein [Nitrospirota bacterium]
RRGLPLLTRGAYFQYVSTTKWRERRWWLFSTFTACGSGRAYSKRLFCWSGCQALMKKAPDF